MQFKIPVTQEMLKRVAQVDHFRGAWSAGVPIAASRREQRIADARTRATICACHMAGLRPAPDRVRALLAGSVPAVGEEREIVGYHRALARTYPARDRLLDTTEIRRLHAVVLGAEGEVPEPTPWRDVACDPEAFDAEGHALGMVFQTLPPRLVASSMEDLVTWVELELRSREHHPLLVVGTFVLAFLAANPFCRGNGRLASILLGHMLEHEGYAYAALEPIERLFEERRQAFYEAFDASQTRIWTGEANLKPWLTFFLDALGEHADRVAGLAEEERRATEFSPLQRAIVETVRRHGTAEAGLLMSVTGANRNTLKDNLRRLVERGVLEKTGERRGTRYRLPAALGDA